METLNHVNQQESPVQIASINSRAFATSLAPILFAVFVGVAVADRDSSQTREKVSDLIKDRFKVWDINRDGGLTRQEFIALIEHPQIQGLEAALLVKLYKEREKEKVFAIRQEDIEQKVANSDFAVHANKLAKTMEKSEKALFANDKEPTLAGCEQKLGNCYMSAPLAALVNRNPASVRAMITPLANGQVLVRWGSGEFVRIYPPTDGELVLMERLHNPHGRWAAVLEKAYSAFNEQAQEKRKKQALDFNRTVKDLIGHGGHADTALNHIAGTRIHHTIMDKVSMPELSQILNAINERKLLAVVHVKDTWGSDANQTPSIPGKHVNAVLGYDAKTQMVHVYNQNRPSFKPKGPEGLQNGYVTKSGHFYVPLAEFKQIWGRLTHETGEPRNGNGQGKDSGKSKGKKK